MAGETERLLVLERVRDDVGGVSAPFIGYKVYDTRGDPPQKQMAESSTWVIDEPPQEIRVVVKIFSEPPMVDEYWRGDVELNAEGMLVRSTER